MGRKRNRGLSADDKALWDRVAQSATPLNHPARRGPVEAKTVVNRPKAKPAPPATPLQEFRVGERAGRKAHDPQQPRTLSERIAETPVRMDHAAYRKMLRGKIRPEGRIDLHGMTLAQAHPVLTGFIIDAHDAGKRLVLVITGKGKDRDDGDPIPIRQGVLRHQVPNWLHAPPLGAMVLDIRAAHQKHGGGGAYYVYLRRRR